MIYENLRDNLYAEVEYPPQLKQLINEAVPWQYFCGLDPVVKNAFNYPAHQEAIDPGYQRRFQSKGSEDKEFFHYIADNPNLIKHYNLDWLVEHHMILSRFFDYAEQVHIQATDLARQVGKVLSKQVPLLEPTLDAGRAVTTLRFLHYDPKNEAEQILASPHFDRSGFTLHLYESHPGLQVLDFDHQWQDVDIKEGSALVLTGYQLEGVSKGDLQNTRHQVRRVEETGKPLGHRYSMVLFTHLVGGPVYDLSQRAQDQEQRYFKRVW